MRLKVKIRYCVKITVNVTGWYLQSNFEDYENISEKNCTVHLT